MAESPEEGLPLQEKSEGAPAIEQKGSAGSSPLVLSKAKAIAILVVIIVLVIIIIVLAAVLGSERAKRHAKGGKEGSVEPSSPPTTQPPGPWDNIRLPDSILPSHYDLHLNVDPNKDGFTGHEKITIDAVTETPHIIIHSNMLNITKAFVTKKGSGSVGIKKRFHVQKTNFLVIQTEETLKGQYFLELEFSGIYRKSLFGLFKGFYRQNTGKPATFLSTQLEPLDGRTMFPCFDEPALKATFKISLTYPKDMVGLSNNEVEKEETKDDMKTTTYKPSPKMSTYLVSVVVGHFEHKELKSTNGVLIRAFAQPGNKDQMDFALKMGEETLTQMENTFGIKYPMPKLDFVATPECYIAMENWGSIRFEEDGLLYKKDFSSEDIQQNLLVRWLAHEIVHMWFGNIVTTKWWDDLWLNEAITDFFTYHDGSPKSINDWKLAEHFVHSNLGYALGIDGLVNSRPVAEPTEVPTIDTFDNIVYKKGSSLLNMAKHFYPTKAKYNEGMKNYLNKFSYGNAVGSDLWTSLQSTCPLAECPNFNEVMKTWMTVTNYPVLTVKKSTNGKYIVQQERFVYDKTAKVDKKLWLLSFSYATSPATKTSDKPIDNDPVWMHQSGTPFETVQIKWDGNGWIKGNQMQKNFYRVNYDDTTWQKLSEQLSHDHSVLSDQDRYGLIDDAFNLARGERVGISRAMDMTKYITKEKSYLPWMAVYKNLQYIVGILPADSDVNKLLKRYLAQQSKPYYDSLGLKNTGSHIEKLLRRVVVSFQCQSGSTSCLGNITTMFNEWKKNPMTTSVTPALRGLVYFYGVRQGNRDDWKKVLDQLYKNTIASEYQSLIMGLAGSRDIGVLNGYLVLMLNESIVKEQYLKYVLDDVANHNPIGAELMWSYIKFNWHKLKGNNPIGAMMKFLQITTQRFSTEDHLQQLEKFINDNLNGQPMPRLLRKTIEIVKLNVVWRKTHESDLNQWLRNFFKVGPTSQPPGFGDSA